MGYKEEAELGSVGKAHPGRRAKKLVNLDKEYLEWGVTLPLRKSRYGRITDSARKMAE